MFFFSFSLNSFGKCNSFYFNHWRFRPRFDLDVKCKQWRRKGQCSRLVSIKDIFLWASFDNFGGYNEFKYCFWQLHMWIDLITRQMTFFSGKVQRKISLRSLRKENDRILMRVRVPNDNKKWKWQYINVKYEQLERRTLMNGSKTNPNLAQGQCEVRRFLGSLWLTGRSLFCTDECKHYVINQYHPEHYSLCPKAGKYSGWQ